ncbi:MAG: CHAT domain-containing protein [Symploca sp. SIO2C1]|nr:CHAT domain-containing protein [Symploca sp. SIO2C1]
MATKNYDFFSQLYLLLHRSRSQGFWLSTAVLTFLLVTTVSPGVAQHPSTFPAATRESLVLSTQNYLKDTEHSDASTLLESGKTLFAAGKLTEAARIWQQAAVSYSEQGNLLGQARSLNYLSLAYLNLGEWEPAQRTITQSLNLLQTPENLPEKGTSILAEGLNTQGNIQLALGQTATALDTWQQAAIAYESVGDITGKLGTQINQARALQSLGNYRRSQKLLEQALAQLQSQPDVAIQATGLRMLGVALQAVGDLSQSKELLEQSLAITRQLEGKNPIFGSDMGATLLSLGNTLTALQEIDAALKRYQQAATVATNPLTRTEALLNQLNLLVKNQQWIEAQTLLPQIQSNLLNLSPSRASVYAQVNFAANLMKMSMGEWGDAETRRRGEKRAGGAEGAGGAGGEEETMKTKGTIPNSQFPIPNSQFPIPKQQTTNNKQQFIAQLLAKAIKEARTLQDPQAEAYALGQLGHLYELTTQWQEAKELTEQAIVIAQKIKAADIVAPWQWQLGRILKEQDQINQAVAAYSSAVATLQSLRQELVTSNPDFQFSFTESVEPVYRELVALLLQSNPSQANLKQARELIEALQLAELENFFRQACLQPLPQMIDEVDVKAAVVYPMILPDRLAVIVSRPGKPLFHYETKLPQAEIENAIDQLRLYLSPHFFDEDRLRESQQLYDWLIKPAESELVANGVETLVFVLDGSLRSLPMSALHDGERYLIEKYSIALTPGLQLLESQPLKLEEFKVLTAGLSEPRQGFSALPAVEEEVNQIASEVPSAILLNSEFTSEQLKSEINSIPFPVIHLATHGQFSSKAQETFLVTWDGNLKVKDLAELLQTRKQDITNPLELLVLSACQTATGDKKAALGLAGFAVRSGARSTLATLWQVNDESTANLMVEFYSSLTQQSGITKAKALRIAQLKLLEQPQYQHPFYWAPFVLVGNWL